jgi:hypothetical protein
MADRVRSLTHRHHSVTHALPGLNGVLAEWSRTQNTTLKMAGDGARDFGRASHPPAMIATPQWRNRLRALRAG